MAPFSIVKVRSTGPLLDYRKHLAQICCFRDELPQGAPTSPIVSNMICARMDTQLQRLAKKHRCFYTRYADDITFSTTLKVFPYTLGGNTSTGKAEVGRKLLEIIDENGFCVNETKVRLQGKHGRQEVTGLTVNEKPNVPRTYVRQIRAMLYAWSEFGHDAAEEEFLNEYDEKYRGPYKETPSFGEVVRGKIEFLGMVRGKQDRIYCRFLSCLRELAPELVSGAVCPHEVLLEKFEELEGLNNPQKRGYALEEFLGRIFEFYEVPLKSSFTRNKGAEQIDGAFLLDGWYYIVECRWRKKLADIREVDGLYGPINRSGRQTMGLFLSVNGWSDNVPTELKQNPEKAIILMDGEDLRTILRERIELPELIRAKTEHFNLYAEPYYGAQKYLDDHVSK